MIKMTNSLHRKIGRLLESIFAKGHTEQCRLDDILSQIESFPEQTEINTTYHYYVISDIGTRKLKDATPEETRKFLSRFFDSETYIEKTTYFWKDKISRIIILQEYPLGRFAERGISSTRPYRRARIEYKN